ncbi:glycoside hydrolase family 3 N-terminal domain-containing protein [Lipingzhangella sp. LS1_29]|uniref:Glycoside hydrolase family 3 N-terminal domain-containing protein n=1 Tax=Lipingzhangella rawalii TaxID=2055835 RepID=A0ABU2H1V6_9ACTN|nr:glycoside hydrolase family 3 N-terminal domain-containing protein [Lipingzhangella rawalii]MDS1268845.1 glycoside hydrolase family 3 N-terminal domain-containing protein [Lipingzhangella rawalii]
MSAPAGNHAPTSPTAADLPPWSDPEHSPEERVEALLAAMTPQEKVAQLSGVWLGASDVTGNVAPFQREMADENFEWSDWVTTGVGHITRPFGSAPITPTEGARRLRDLQHQVTSANRFAIPALAHEECLTGWTTWKATIFPTPLAWGATFDPDLVSTVAEQIGASMYAMGVHQGLAPVLDVTRDLRWGRTEETIGEDPYLVGTIGTAYVQGLQHSGVHATLKHFAGYSAARSARNFGPVSIGPREFAELLLPFEMAIRDGKARSVMASYTAVDGVPSHADTSLLTDLLRQTWGFDGVVVADYFGVSFLQTLHQVAEGRTQAARHALEAGLDIELPMVNCFGPPLLSAVEAGKVDTETLNRAARRVLHQKCQLGLLDHDWTPTPPGLAPRDSESAREPDLDPPAARTLARRTAEESVILLANDGHLPLDASARIALVGPLADDPNGMLGCYTFPRHVGQHHPELPLGVAIPTLTEALRAELPTAQITHAVGCTVSGDDVTDIPAAVRTCQEADVCVAVLGDLSGLFGGGTSGEGCDATDLDLPGQQGELLQALLDTGVPVVAVVLSGRPYALGTAQHTPAAVVQAFFPGQEGAAAVAGVLTGRVNPSGRLPVSVPARGDVQPSPHTVPRLGHVSDVSSVDPTPRYPFGHGLSYTEFTWSDIRINDVAADPTAPQPLSPDATTELSVRVGNSGNRHGTEVVQLYAHRPVAEATQPEARLIGYTRVELAPGQQRCVRFRVPAGVLAIADRCGQWIHAPGPAELRIAASSTDIRGQVPVTLEGPRGPLPPDRPLRTYAEVH